MRKLLLASILVGFLLVSLSGLLPANPALAQDVSPGSACSTAGAFNSSGGPELSGAGHFMVCSGGVWVSAISYSSTGNALFPGAFSLPGDISPPQITANQDNYNPAGLATATVLRLNTNASRNITGLQTGGDGRIVTILNVGTFPIVLMNDVTSTAANRFLLGSNVTLNANQSLSLIYDSNSSRWRSVGTLPSSSAAAGGSDRQMQFNNAGSVGGVPQFNYTTGGLLSFWRDRTDTAGTSENTSIFMTNVTPTSAQTVGSTTWGLGGQAYITNTNPFQVRKVGGVNAYADNRGTGAVESIHGSSSYVAAIGSAAVTQIIGSYNAVQVDAGTVADAFGIHSHGFLNGGSVTNYYGVFIDPDIFGSTITNRYALYLNSPAGTATNDWGIYQGSTQNNRLSGALGIGKNPVAGRMLDVEAASGSTAVFSNTGATGIGVYGYASNTTGANYGIMAETESTAGIGAYGRAKGATGTNYGGYFETNSTTGRGVYGTATTGSGTNYGVFGFTNSTGGYGVYGQNSNATGYGVYCQSGNTNGCGGNRAWYNASDVRLKDDVVDLGPASGLDAIMKLRPVRYNWKDIANDRTELGFLAQDVEAVFPELVGVGPDQEITLEDGTKITVESAKVMSYGQMAVPLVKAVQELKAENDNLRLTVEELTRRLDQLEARAE